jgi:hypothetical protein
VESTENDGSYGWTVPDEVSDHCLVQIPGDFSDTAPTDASDAEFSIVPPTGTIITVIYPNGGDIVYEGSKHDITWTCPGTIANVVIEYSTDNGATWSEIIASTPNDGRYQWTVPGTPSETCLVRVSDMDGNHADVSDAVFTIEPETISHGKQGQVVEKKPDGSYGDTIPSVLLTWVSEDGSVTKYVTTDINGYYRISLSPQRYVVTAEHPDYQTYGPIGFYIVTGVGYQFANFFLTRK